MNRLQHTGQVLIHIAVPEPKHMEAAFVQLFITGSVALLVVLKIMLSAVNLDNKSMLQTHEINDVTCTRRLTSEMKAFGSPRAKVIPDLHLLWRHRLA
jgi:hypothetical protein